MLFVRQASLQYQVHHQHFQNLIKKDMYLVPTLQGYVAFDEM